MQRGKNKTIKMINKAFSRFFILKYLQISCRFKTRSLLQRTRIIAYGTKTIGTGH